MDFDIRYNTNGPVIMIGKGTAKSLRRYFQVAKKLKSLLS